MSMTWEETSVSATSETVVATRIPQQISLNAAQPVPEWEQAAPISFCADWQGQRRETARETEVRILWTPKSLYLRFVCRYKTLFVFDNADPSGRRDHLWDRDVAEAFFQSNPSRSRHYREFEVSPNGMWIDLDIFPGGMRHLKSGLHRSVWLDEARQRWVAELAIPMRAITSNFNPSVPWRANFYRVEGNREPRFYSAWQPTRTAEPNFHVPESFGKLLFLEE
jgi:alpha-galactosidase